MGILPVVLYSDQIGELEEGSVAMVFPVNHPNEMVSNNKYVLTSMVEEIMEGGCFRTKNTIYMPETVMIGEGIVPQGTICPYQDICGIYQLGDCQQKPANQFKCSAAHWFTWCKINDPATFAEC